MTDRILFLLISTPVRAVATGLALLICAAQWLGWRLVAAIMLAGTASGVVYVLRSGWWRR